MDKQDLILPYIRDHTAVVPFTAFLFEFEVDEIAFPYAVPSTLVTGFGLRFRCSRKTYTDGFV